MNKVQLRKLLQDCRADALLCTSEINRRYTTEFPSSAGLAYFSTRQAVFFTDSRYIEAARAAIREFEVREIQSGQTYAGLANELLTADGAKRVALEYNALAHADFLSWEKALRAETVNLSVELEKLRQVKTAYEIEQITAAQRIAEQALTDILKEIRPGASEKEIAARLIYLMLHYGAENLSFDPIVVSGQNSSKPHGVPTDKKIESGDFVTMDFGCIVNGYCSDMTRTVAVGYATDEMRHVYDTALAAQLTGIAHCKAGVTGQSVDAVARQVITDAGYGEAFGHGFGHGVGLEIHEAPTIGQRGKALLAAGNIVTAEPGIYLPGKFGVRIEDMLAVTQDGCINLTRAPKDLLILPA